VGYVEVDNDRRAGRAVETFTELDVRRVFEVGLQAGHIVEVNCDEDVYAILRTLFVGRADGHSFTDTHCPHGRNSLDGLLERVRQALAFVI